MIKVVTTPLREGIGYNVNNVEILLKALMATNSRCVNVKHVELTVEVNIDDELVA